MVTFRGENESDAGGWGIPWSIVFMVLGKELPLWLCELALVKTQTARFWYDFPID